MSNSGERVIEPVGADRVDYRQRLLGRIEPASLAAALECMEWLGVPERLTYLRRVLDHLVPMRRDLDEIAQRNEQELPDFFDKGLAALDAALAREYLDADDPAFALPQRNNDPMWGTISGHQLYAMVPYLPGPKVKARSYRLLKCQLLCAAALIWSSERRAYPRGAKEAITEGAKAVRELRIEGELLQRLPQEPCSAEQYVGSVAALIADDALKAEVRAQLEAAMRPLRYLLGDESAAEPFLRPRQSRGEPTEGRRRITSTTYSSYSRSEASAARQSGLAPGEITDGDEYLCIEDVEEDTGARWTESAERRRPARERPPRPKPTLAELVLRRKYEIQARERADQLLPAAWGYLGAPELALVANDARDLLLEAAGRHKAGEADHERYRELAAALAGMLWTARDPEALCGLMLYRNAGMLPVSGRLPGLVYLLEEDEWCFEAARPKGSPRFDGFDLSRARPVCPLVRLPASAAVRIFVRRLPQVEAAMREGRVRAFRTGPAELAAAIRARLGALSKRCRGRITAVNVRDALFVRAIARCRDLAFVSAMLGRTHRLSDTQLHYAALDPKRLADTYVALASEIEDEIVAENRALDPSRPHPREIKPPPLPPAPAEARAGSAQDKGGDEEGPPWEGAMIGPRIVPAHELVEDLKRAVADALADVRARPGVVGFMLRHHNLLTLYTVLLLKFATGMRDIRSPLPRPEDIDFEAKELIVSDKDGASAFHTRVLPMIDVLGGQLLAYRKHLHALAGNIALSAPKLAKTLFGHPHFGVDPGERRTELRPLFFARHEPHARRWHFRAVSRASVLDLMKAEAIAYPLPSNTNRHYLRTELAEAGCPGAAIDYLMGHWTRGREPLGRYATCPLGELIGALRTPIEALARRDGWEVVEGLP